MRFVLAAAAVIIVATALCNNLGSDEPAPDPDAAWISSAAVLLYDQLGRGHKWVEPEDPLARVARLMVLGEEYTCDVVLAVIGEGPSARGREGKIMCEVDGRKLFYDVQMWADMNRFSVLPGRNPYD